MATCKDCLHVDICEHYAKTLNQKLAQYCNIQIPFEKEKPHSEPCEFFKDRSRFVKVPCKVGDRVYYIANVNGKDEINSAVVQKVTIHFENEVGYDCGIGEIGFSNRSIGKRVFLTKEQAEQALKEREKNGKC